LAHSYQYRLSQQRKLHKQGQYLLTNRHAQAKELQQGGYQALPVAIYATQLLQASAESPCSTHTDTQELRVRAHELMIVGVLRIVGDRNPTRGWILLALV
jgi:hypothetical protein